MTTPTTPKKSSILSLIRKDWPMCIAYVIPTVTFFIAPDFAAVRYRRVEHFYQLFGTSFVYYMFLAGAIALPFGLIAFRRRKDLWSAGAILVGALALSLGVRDIIHQL
ncbi:MAG: hypothetical protein SFY80_08730 [Verrucomicrobiota bacterium]|nr:hypothetical protein [Verrucomicrobiota bacterium]